MISRLQCAQADQCSTYSELFLKKRLMKPHLLTKSGHPPSWLDHLKMKTFSDLEVACDLDCSAALDQKFRKYSISYRNL